jgi:uracil-DNA glycosylase family 4
MGESELMLDTLAVDDVLKLIAGASGGAGVRSSTATPSAAPSAAPPTSLRDTDDLPPGSSDWRQALMNAGAGPGAPPSRAESQPAPPKPIEQEKMPSKRYSFDQPAEPVVAASTAVTGITVGTPSVEMFGGKLSSLATLEAIAAEVAKCTKCPLYSTAKNPVPGEGNPNADLMCVGEAPGATEDETGRPFIGAAGQLLTKILAAIDLPREQVYICNVLKHRPPGNRNPMPQEVTACSPYLIRQIELIKPKVILALGTFAAQTLLDTKTSIGKLRGQVHRYYGVPLVVTYHPAALLRNPGWKRPTWEDVQLARRILDSPSAGA